MVNSFVGAVWGTYRDTKKEITWPQTRSTGNHPALLKTLTYSSAIFLCLKTTKAHMITHVILSVEASVERGILSNFSNKTYFALSLLQYFKKLYILLCLDEFPKDSSHWLKLILPASHGTDSIIQRDHSVSPVHGQHLHLPLAYKRSLCECGMWKRLLCLGIHHQSI